MHWKKSSQIWQNGTSILFVVRGPDIFRRVTIWAGHPDPEEARESCPGQGSKSAKFFRSGAELWSGNFRKFRFFGVFHEIFAKNCSKGTKTLTDYS
jgi:hypothetical protein